MKNDDSLKFYTGIPILGCFNMLVNLITLQAEKLKYWDKNKNKKKLNTKLHLLLTLGQNEVLVYLRNL